MGIYLTRRLLQSILVIIFITIIVFFGMRFLPGDPILMSLTKGQLGSTSMEQVEKIRHEMGLDKPILVQYVNWIGDILHGDFGQSISTRNSVWDTIVPRLPVSLHLTLLAFIFCNLLGIPAGIIAAIRRGSWLDNTVTSIANIGVTVPVFWLGILMIYAFGLKLHWLPIFGYTSPFDDFAESTKGVIMPVICLAVPYIASAARLTRSSLLEVMKQDYVRTAWSKGLRERTVVFGHALKNSLIPVVTMQGMAISQLIGGAVIIEAVFGIPGLGRLSQQAMIAQDYPVVQAIVLLTAVIVLGVNILVDVSYGWIDPRVRYD